MPPELATKEYDEETILKEELAAKQDLFADKKEHEDDKVNFDIAVINKANEAVTFECAARSGQVYFDRIRICQENGLMAS